MQLSAELEAWSARQRGRCELVEGLSARLRDQAQTLGHGPDYEDVACAVLFELIGEMLDRLASALGPEVLPEAGGCDRSST